MHGRHTLPANVSPPLSPGDRVSADRAQFEQWCELAEEWVLSTLASIALSRSAELAARSTLNVRVVQPPREHSSVHSGKGRSSFRVVSLALGSARVDLYAAREPGQTPAIHFALTRAPVGNRFPAILSLPGCLIVRRGNGEIVLLGAEARGLPDMRPAVTFDAVVLKAFELLIGAFHATPRAA